MFINVHCLWSINQSINNNKHSTTSSLSEINHSGVSVILSSPCVCRCSDTSAVCFVFQILRSFGWRGTRCTLKGSWVTRSEKFSSFVSPFEFLHFCQWTKQFSLVTKGENLHKGTEEQTAIKTTDFSMRFWTGKSCRQHSGIWNSFSFSYRKKNKTAWNFC